MLGLLEPCTIFGVDVRVVLRSVSRVDDWRMCGSD